MSEYGIPGQQGWECPKCGQVNAPWKPTCDCHKKAVATSGPGYFERLEIKKKDPDAYERLKNGEGG